MPNPTQTLKRNAPILQFPALHPARMFLEAFVSCKVQCVAREIPYGGRRAIDQEWFSEIDQRKWKFSGFAYAFLSYDVVLDGWLTNPPCITDGERETLRWLPYLRTLLAECSAAASAERNIEVIQMVQQVISMLDLREECIRLRMRQIGLSECDITPLSDEERLSQFGKVQ